MPFLRACQEELARHPPLHPLERRLPQNWQNLVFASTRRVTCSAAVVDMGTGRASVSFRRGWAAAEATMALDEEAIVDRDVEW